MQQVTRMEQSIMIKTIESSFRLQGRCNVA